MQISVKWCFFGSGNPKPLNINDRSLKFKPSCTYLAHPSPRKYILLFYHAVAKSIISYILLIYGSASKISLGMIKTSASNDESNLFQNQLDPINPSYSMRTVFELYLSELLKELLQQLRHEDPV